MFAHFFLYSSFISVSQNGDMIAGAKAAIMDHEVIWKERHMMEEQKEVSLSP